MGDTTYDDFKRYMERLLESVSYIHRLYIAGGEGLLCKDFPKIIRYVCQLPQVGYVDLLTTGTVRMNSEMVEACRNPRVIVYMDNYGDNKGIAAELTENYKSNIELMKKENITYREIDNTIGTWYDMTDVKRDSDATDNLRKNRECAMRSCFCVSPTGKMSWCNRNLMAIEYGMIPADRRDYCNLSDEADSKRVREIINLKYLHGCEYCCGSREDNIVPAGVQM